MKLEKYKWWHLWLLIIFIGVALKGIAEIVKATREPKVGAGKRLIAVDYDPSTDPGFNSAQRNAERIARNNQEALAAAANGEFTPFR